jgi:hypothetical protein
MGFGFTNPSDLDRMVVEGEGSKLRCSSEETDLAGGVAGGDDEPEMGSVRTAGGSCGGSSGARPMFWSSRRRRSSTEDGSEIHTSYAAE